MPNILKRPCSRIPAPKTFRPINSPPLTFRAPTRRSSIRRFRMHSTCNLHRTCNQVSSYTWRLPRPITISIINLPGCLPRVIRSRLQSRVLMSIQMTPCSAPTRSASPPACTILPPTRLIKNIDTGNRHYSGMFPVLGFDMTWFSLCRYEQDSTPGRTSL